MVGHFSIFLALILLNFQAQAKDFSWTQSTKGTPLSVEEEHRFTSEISCHISENLKAHFEFIQENVIPRLASEIPQLLSPHPDSKGELFQVAESIDYGDLFHAHTRIPLQALQPTKPGALSPLITDPNQYHLQYHSYEYEPYIVQGWLKQLTTIDNNELKTWLFMRKAYVEKLKAYSPFSSQPPPSFEKLSKTRIEHFAEIWLSKFKPKGFAESHYNWYFKRTIEKLRILDPSDMFLSGRSLSRARSIVSTQDQFWVINQLNIDSFIQPATVYFAPRTQVPEINNIIEEVQKEGFTKLVNSTSESFDTSSFPKDFPFEIHQQFVDKLKKAAKNSPDNLFTFKHIAAKDYSFEKHFVFFWDKNYLYSVTYFLKCP